MSQAQTTTNKSSLSLLVASALFFSLNTPIAPLFFQAGGNAASLNITRILITAIFALITLKLLGQNLLLSRQALKISAFVGGFSMLQGLCYLASVKYIPVGLAALIFFTWPITVALASPLIGEKAASPRSLVIFLFAFMGLGFALGPSLENLDMRGVGLALCGSGLIAAMILSIKKAIRDIPPLSLASTSSFFGAFFLLLALPLLGGWQFPTSTEAFYPALAVGLVFFLATLTQNFALRHASAQLAAIIFNLEPVFSIFAAFLILGEVLLWQQYLGASIVVISLCFYNLTLRRYKKTPEA